ncbi:site-specific integrase [Spirosoma sp. HMF4905]|uniref:Site-specific integrase n=1 Tax=Spirosoma arboris TaxID=2682092 RepID=A0A7K1SM76_9BACT|nr:phage integrase SAM-like domain-containing protein [Spirosoma arboris]MVM34884.1 site-specific integrase [Spirosoma arboris]
MIIPPTLTSDLKEYLEYKESTLREDSYKVYRLFGDKFAKFLKTRKLTDLQTRKTTPKLCEDYKRYILKLHKHPTTRNKEIGQMKGFFYQFTKPGWERFKVSPAANVELVPKQDSEMHEPFNEEQTALIIGNILQKKDYWLLLYIYMIHYTFARPGREVRLMKVGDIKPKTLLIRPENSKTRRTKTPTIAKPVEQLIEYLGVKNLPLQYYIFGANGCPGTVPCGRNMYYHRHRQILKELKIEGKYTLYGWKHTGNIRAITLGINERELQFQNGFRDFRTLEIYVRKLSAYMSSEIYDKFV